MTVRVERTIAVPVSPTRVWSFIADPENRARAISVVEGYAEDEHTGEMTWNVQLPVPFVDSSVTVHTEDVVRDPPTYVEFEARSKIMHVQGEHWIEPSESGCTLTNRFVVEGRLPGVEGFFERNLDTELSNIETALRRDLELEA
jgi:carbon monoxide dehydrogenase subunit G